MCNALGIISFTDPNVYVEGMQDYRPLAAVTFLGRYRLIDFPLSNMTNSGIDNIKVYVNGNPRSLIAHVGRGRQYNINSKRGQIELLPWYQEPTPSRHSYATDVESYYGSYHTIKEDKNDYVIIAPVNFVMPVNYNDLLSQHMESGAEISMLYQNVDDAKDHYVGLDVLQMNRQKGVLHIEQNLGNYKTRSLSLQTYVMSKEIFLNLIQEARSVSKMYWLKDIINDHCKDMDIRGISYRGKFYAITDLQSYYDSNMDILDNNYRRTFSNPDWPIYTRTNDSAPAIYLNGGNACKSLVSNGAQISGTVKNSIIGRSCKIGKNAVIENCVLLPGVSVADGAILKNVVVDKYSTIAKKKELEGKEGPLYIGRRENI